MKRCIYCGAEISDDSIVDFCERCGIGVFGKKMFDAIIQNMEEAKLRGDIK
jgi:rRNA maturation endonuclease Nob1